LQKIKKRKNYIKTKCSTVNFQRENGKYCTLKHEKLK
jgi:hypothetical protein